MNKPQGSIHQNLGLLSVRSSPRNTQDLQSQQAAKPWEIHGHTPGTTGYKETMAATWDTSLSPRPDRFTMTRDSLSIVGAR
jgi:hypothetical protein